MTGAGIAISDWVVVSRNVAARNDKLLRVQGITLPVELYGALECNYPKFYKMDVLCKWAVVAAEYLFANSDELYRHIDRSRIAVVLGTHYGCADVDKRYMEQLTMPSPALFVYTLPNIMLGELCIRHGFKGEQLCTLHEAFDADELFFNVHALMNEGGMDACLCGWADARTDHHDICFFWVTKGQGTKFSAEAMRRAYSWHR